MSKQVDVKEDENPVPVQGENPSSVQDENPVPVQSEKSLSVQDENPLPVQSENPSSVENENILPAQGENPSSVQDENPLPAQSENPSSVQNGNPLPVENENPLPPQDGFGFTNSKRRLREEMLLAHNKLRAHHCVQPLQLDHRLNRLAQFAAEQLANTNGLRQSDTHGAGQNIFTKSSTNLLGSIDGREPTHTWHQGSRYYNFDQGGFSMEAGSFTQLVWANSRKLGVGIAYTPDGHTAYIVALYLPPGNYGNEYRENVFPAQC